MTAESAARVRLTRRARTLVLVGLAYNVFEGVVALASGVAAGSVALIGFGLDSYIEVFAAAVMVWRLSRAFHSQEVSEAAERRAIFLIGITFFLLAAYIVVQSSLDLALRRMPEESLVGIGLGIASLLIMPSFSWMKLRLASRLGSRSLRAEALETLACSYLTVALLLGLGLNVALGWWWADPVAALAMVPWLLKEGRENVSGEDEREGAQNGASL